MPLNFGKAMFSRSAGAPKDFLKDGLPQFAFAGRSNVGKSSVINRLLNRKNLAYVGASPGKTTQINYFLVDDRAYLVDFGPGVVREVTPMGGDLLLNIRFDKAGDKLMMAKTAAKFMEKL